MIPPRASHEGAVRAASHPDGSVPGSLAASRGDLIARILLPRGREILFKWMLLPVGALIAVCARQGQVTVREVGEFALLWVVAEQLAYQARYQLNDLRDRRADAAHPAGRARGRLSFPWTPLRAALVWSSVALRLVLAVVLSVVVLSGPAREAALVYLPALVVISSAYELARERIRREGAPPGSARARGLALPLFACVPLGYALRVWTGYHALAAASAPPALAVVTALAVLVLYTGTVLLAWTLEGTSLITDPSADGTWPALARRAHVGTLVAHAGLLVRQQPAPGGPAPDALVVARDRPSRSWADLRIWDTTAALALPLSYVLAAVGVRADSSTATVMVGAGVLSALAPLVAHVALSRAPGPWDCRTPWLGGGALAATVAVEITLFAVAVLAVLLHAPLQARLLWVPAFFLFQIGSVRASSYARGFGPGSLLKRPVAWWRARASTAGAA